MKYGYFDDKNREYVITRPDTPLPWINYLGCESYFGILSATGGGYSYYRDARLRRITRGRYNNVPMRFRRALHLSARQCERGILVAELDADAKRAGGFHLPPWAGLQHDFLET